MKKNIRKHPSPQKKEKTSQETETNPTNQSRTGRAIKHPKRFQEEEPKEKENQVEGDKKPTRGRQSKTQAENKSKNSKKNQEEEDESLCVICWRTATKHKPEEKGKEDDWTQCDKCNRWAMNACIPITPQKNEKWLCRECKTDINISKLVKTIERQEEENKVRINKMNEARKEMKKDVTRIERKIDTILSHLTTPTKITLTTKEDPKNQVSSKYKQTEKAQHHSIPNVETPESSSHPTKEKQGEENHKNGENPNPIVTDTTPNISPKTGTPQEVRTKDPPQPLQELKKHAHTHNLIVEDVPKDGNCFFHAVTRTLAHKGEKADNGAKLRQRLIEYLQTSPSKDIYSAFLTRKDMNSKDPLENRIDELKRGEWADHVETQATADMLKIKINILTNKGYIVNITPRTEDPKATINVGLLGQTHYVALLTQDKTKGKKKEGGKDKKTNTKETHQINNPKGGETENMKRSNASSPPHITPRNEREKNQKTEDRRYYAREEHKPTITFIGDEQFGIITEDEHLNITAWRRMWRVRLVRGGGVREIRNLIQETTRKEEKSRTAVLSVGGNDLAKIKKERLGRKEAEERITHLVEELSEGINEMYNAGYGIGILRVPPRGDVIEEDRKNFNQQLYRKQNRREGVTLIDIQVGMPAQKYIKEILKDGINTKEEKGWEILQQILHEIEEETYLPEYPGPIPKSLYLDPSLCWKCNNKHSKEKGCKTKDLNCSRCESSQHNTICCPLRVLLCRKCGRGGHSETTCR